MNCACNEVPDNVALCPIAFAGESLSSAEQWYSNIEREAFGKLHHYCFVKEMYVINDHKPLKPLISKDVVMLP